MARAWKWDINVNLVGGGKHWDPSWPTPGPNQEFYHLNLAHNVMINLMSGYPLREYYSDSVSAAAERFRLAFASVPVDDQDLHKLVAFHQADLDDCDATLQAIAALPAATTTRMQDLYTGDTSSGDLATIVDRFESIQQHMRWICLPFVSLRQDLAHGVPGLRRPTAVDLDVHLNGNTNTAPMGDMDYKDFLLLQLAEPRNLAARQHAFRTRFLDPLNATQRVNGEVPAGMVTSGKGNGYKCMVDSHGQRYCAPTTQPEEYCANGGTICLS